MKVANRSRKWIRLSHRYLGIVVGVQLLIWTLGGIYFSWTNIDEIRGDHLKSSKQLVVNSEDSVDPVKATKNFLSENHSKELIGVELIDVLGRNFYRIEHKNSEGKNKVALISVEDGTVRGPIVEAEAVKIASAARAGESKLVGAVLLEEANVGGHHEYREHRLPAWAVSFEGEENFTVYLSAEDGEIGAFRTDNWRYFDFLWMFHTIDFVGRDNINNYLLRTMSILSLVTIVSGYLLFLISRRRPRKRA